MSHCFSTSLLSGFLWTIVKPFFIHSPLLLKTLRQLQNRQYLLKMETKKPWKMSARSYHTPREGGEDIMLRKCMVIVSTCRFRKVHALFLAISLIFIYNLSRKSKDRSVALGKYKYLSEGARFSE